VKTSNVTNTESPQLSNVKLANALTEFHRPHEVVNNNHSQAMKAQQTGYIYMAFQNIM
jgi:hypothetical protein